MQNLHMFQTYMLVLGFFMGFCTQTAISLLVTVSVEVAPIKIVGVAHAFISLSGSGK